MSSITIIKTDEGSEYIMRLSIKDFKSNVDNAVACMKYISEKSGGLLSKQILKAFTKLYMPGFVSSSFFMRIILLELSEFDIPTSCGECWTQDIINISKT